MAQLVIGRDHPWLSDWATALFAIAAVLLIYAVQFSATFLGYAAAPSERLDYSPEAAFKPDILRKVRERQWEETKLRREYATRMKYCYNFGLLAFPRRPWPTSRSQSFLALAVGKADRRYRCEYFAHHRGNVDRV